MTNAYHHYDKSGWYTVSTPADPHPTRKDAVMPPPYMATLDPLPSEIPPGWQARRIGGAWIVEAVPAVAFLEPSLDDLKGAQIAKLSSACEAHIVGGFASAALGSDHFYPSKLTDQTNLLASVMASLMPGLPTDWGTPFWCADAAGSWRYEIHTAEEIQAVGAAGKASILTALERKATLEAAINAAATPEAVAAVVWEDAEE